MNEYYGKIIDAGSVNTLIGGAVDILRKIGKGHENVTHDDWQRGYTAALSLAAKDLEARLGYLLDDAEDRLKSSVREYSVDELFEGMSQAQRAHMFNKLLKHEGYNPKSVSTDRLLALIDDIEEAKNVSISVG